MNFDWEDNVDTVLYMKLLSGLRHYFGRAALSSSTATFNRVPEFTPTPPLSNVFLFFFCGWDSSGKSVPGLDRSKSSAVPSRTGEWMLASAAAAVQ